MDERDFSLILERYLWAPQHVRLEIAWPCSNELIWVINVIRIISLHGGRENYMIDLYKGDIVHTLCSIRILLDKGTTTFIMD